MKDFSSLLENKIVRFIITGTVGAFINLFFIFLLVSIFGMNTTFLENLANFFSLELSIIFSFIVNRNWTWYDTEREQGKGLFKQAFIFHLIVGGSILLRVILFPLLQLTGINYLINAIIGIGLGAIINFFLYDKYVFHKKKKSELI